MNFAQTLVVDASFLLAILLDELSEVETARAKNILNEHILFAPFLLEIEIGNTILMQVRRKRISEEYAKNLLQKIENIELNFFNLAAIDNIENFLEFSNEMGLTFYDAIYVKLAIRMNSSIASFDKKIIEVAQKMQIETVDLS